jgi:hypothetical protein
VSPGREQHHLCLCQERFLANYDASHSEKLKEVVWTIPVAVASWKKDDLLVVRSAAASSGMSAADMCEPHISKVLFNKPSTEFPCHGYEERSVMKVNPGQTGFYRVAYEASILANLAPYIPLLPPVERLGILRDSFALSSSGRTGMTPSLDLLKHYAQESNYAVVQALAGNLSLLASLHADQPYHPLIQKLVRDMFAANFAKLGWEAQGGQKEDQIQVLFRALVINMCVFGCGC